ncbi:hypothetical protein Aph01nite_58520 [Acrocarpospora phusangensis]|uniref:M23ase beta-sheet core domain-containing protein n=1 Tax=Acrocarpospora phusangensis TaxID=1070424 RepID=A0A919UR23_9ACTN|nr:M23 family metallopeptidase [Acrocarpospora phusangensis]GIH27542.1 hypothetical protein Aph01nite_58520 [Acrocarpospora phusangensis]
MPIWTLVPALLTLCFQVSALAPDRPEAPPRWTWPLSNPQLIRGFDPPLHRWLAGHRGIDLRAHQGQSVMAAGTGVVTFAGEVGGFTAVAITHPGGLRTTYLPVEPAVRPGQPISTATPIGKITSHPVTHCPTTCLHWGLLRGDHYLNPLLLLGLGQVRLLPLNPTRRQVLP